MIVCDALFRQGKLINKLFVSIEYLKNHNLLLVTID